MLYDQITLYSGLKQCRIGQFGYSCLVTNQCYFISIGNSHRFAGPRPTTLEEDRELFVDFSLMLCLWFEIHDMRTYNFFDWVSNTDSYQTKLNWISRRIILGALGWRALKTPTSATPVLAVTWPRSRFNTSGPYPLGFDWEDLAASRGTAGGHSGPPPIK